MLNRSDPGRRPGSRRSCSSRGRIIRWEQCKYRSRFDVELEHWFVINGLSATHAPPATGHCSSGVKASDRIRALPGRSSPAPVGEAGTRGSGRAPRADGASGGRDLDHRARIRDALPRRRLAHSWSVNGIPGVAGPVGFAETRSESIAPRRQAAREAADGPRDPHRPHRDPNMNPSTGPGAGRSRSTRVSRICTHTAPNSRPDAWCARASNAR